MDKLQFLFVIHNHQPVGNFDYVLERSYQQAYKPFLNIFERYPLNLSLHISGPLFDWISKHHPEYIEQIAALVNKDRIEIMGSGYYEPILAAIPEKDAVDQLVLYKQLLEKKFGQTVRGAWLTERVWEPHLPRIFRNAGIEYIPVDDYHFLRSGFQLNELDGYFLSEFENNPLAIYPGSEILRYILPFHTVEEIAVFFRRSWESGISTLVFADDGEKFGVWPQTHKWVYEEHWLEKFFSFLAESSSWIETVTIGRHYDRSDSKGCCYLPTTSYPELGEWALPAPASFLYKKNLDALKQQPNFNEIKPFYQGGHWKNFLAKYSESQFMHKKMTYLSRLLSTAPIQKKKPLFMSQCNDAYWHGVFGGLYLPHLRREINSCFAEATEQACPVQSVDLYDFDLDGKDEIFIKTDTLAVIVDPHDGATISSVDFLPAHMNITDVLTRRREAYHLKLSEAASHDGGTKTIHDQFLVKEQGLEKLLIYDQYRRASFRTHYVSALSLQDFYTANKKTVHPVSIASYEHVIRKKTGEFIFTARGVDWTSEKHCIISGNEITCSLKGSTPTDKPILCSEWNFNLFAPDAPDRYIQINNTSRHCLNVLGDFPIAGSIALIDEWFKIKILITTNDFENVLLYPVETVSLSEAGAEKTFQGTCLILTATCEKGFFEKSFKVTIESI